MSKSKGIPVAEFLRAQISVSEKTQTQIAEEAGFGTPNMIAMIKTGKAKIPVDRVLPLARALGIDKMELLRRVLMEYQPVLWATLEEAFGAGALVSTEELALVKLVRSASGNYLPDLSDPKVKQLMTDAAKEASKITLAKDKGAIDRHERRKADVA